MLPAPNRLRQRADFASAVRSSAGLRAGSRLMVVHAHPTDTRARLPPRVGFVVSRAVGNAVVRNRTKRRLRAILGARLGRLPDGLDLVVRANPAAASASSAELARSLDPLLDRMLRRLGGVS